MTDKEANDIAEAMYDRDPVYEFERQHWLAYQREKEEWENGSSVSNYGMRTFFQLPKIESERTKTPVEYVIEILITLGLGVMLINTLLSLIL